MRWEALFADLEAQLAAAGQAGLDAEIADRQRGELAGLDLAARLRAQYGKTLRVHLGLSGGPLTGTLGRLGADWFLLDSASGSHVAALGAVQMIEGIDRYADLSVRRSSCRWPPHCAAWPGTVTRWTCTCAAGLLPCTAASTGSAGTSLNLRCWNLGSIGDARTLPL
ncbi:hypothetical protein ACFVRT_00970 [Arthrobacter koreensis]|uniref:hypothetical protein n=1 Tax=Arthrobacter koreensis TaxID=199136 RepID=UPI0036D95854